MGDEKRPPHRSGSGWSRVALVIVLLAAVLAFVAWNVDRGAQTPSVAAGNVKPQEQSRKPLPSDPQDASRERPERERTSRPGGQ